MDNTAPTAQTGSTLKEMSNQNTPFSPEQPVTTNEATSVAALGAELSKLRDEAGRGGAVDAKTRILGLLFRLEQPRLAAPRDEESASSLLSLKATGYALLGSVDEAEGRVSEAVPKFERAATLFEQAILEGQLSAVELSDYGMALLGVERPVEAIAILEEAVALGAATSQTFRCLGRAFHAVGRYAEAEVSFRKGLVVDPFNPLLLRDLAVSISATGARSSEAALLLYDAATAHASAGQVDVALATYDEALAVDPSCAKAWTGKAEALRLSGRPRDALTAVDRSLELAPEDIDAQGAKAATLAALRRFGECLDLVDNLLAKTADDEALLDLKAFALLSLGRTEEGLTAIEEVIHRHGETPSRLRIYGSSLRMIGRLDEAVAALKKAIAAGPDPGALAELGECFRLLREFDQALEALDSALRMSPNDPWTLATRGQVLERLNRREEAITSLQRALVADDTMAWAEEELGKLLFEEMRFSDALAAFERAVVRLPGTATLLVRKARTLKRLDRLTDAVEAFQQAIAADPGLEVAAAELGEVLRLLGREVEALAAFDRALALKPGDPWTLGSKAQVLKGLDQFDEAVLLLREALTTLREAAPDEAYGWVQSELVECLQLAGRGEEALLAIEGALIDFPRAPWAVSGKADILLRLGRPALAVEFIEPLLTEMPTLRGAFGEALRMLDRYDEALNEFDKVLEANPEEWWVLASKGSTLYSLDRYDEALVALERALELHPLYPWAQGIAAAVLFDLAEFDRVLALVEKVIATGEGANWTFELKGWTLHYLGRDAEAIDVIRRALTITPDSPEVRLMLADIQLFVGQPHEAEEGYRWFVSEIQAHLDDLDADARSQIGWAHYRLSEYREAIGFFSEALSLDSGRVDIRFSCGMALLCGSRADLALEMYQRALVEVRQGQLRRAKAIVWFAGWELQDALARHPEISESVAAPILALLAQPFGQAEVKG